MTVVMAKMKTYAAEIFDQFQTGGIKLAKCGISYIYPNMFHIQLIQKYMDKCIKCGLPGHYQGITLNENHVCNYCEFYETHKETFSNFDALEKQFEEEVENAKKKAAERGAIP